MDSFIAERSAFIASAEPGVEATRRLSDMTDEVVRALARAASSRLSQRWALVALGGWGAGGLQPRSDLDILVLSDAPADALKPFVESVLYPLWDAGLKVGHQVRGPKQQAQAMRDDLKTCTAALTARPFAGDIEWADGVLTSSVAAVAKRRKELLRKLDERPRPGSPYLLQPDLKENAGGRRDYDELVWRAGILSGLVTRDPGALVAHGLLGDEELSALTEASQVCAAARWECHVAAGSDTLDIDTAAELKSVDAERVQKALAVTAMLLERVRKRADGGDIERAPMSAAVVCALLDRGPDSLAELETATQAGRLDHLVPGLSALMTCRRPGLGHELTVGAHSINAATLIAGFADDPWLGRSLAAVPDRRLVQVAALAHDAGKLEGGAGHAERGEPVAREAAIRFGLGEHAAEQCAALVGRHLVLAESALRDDVDDEDAVLRCAARVGDRDLVAPLHLLTAADSLATGPAQWTSWTAALVASLVSRLDAALSPDVDGAGLAERGEAVRASALAASADDAAARAFITGAPLRYLASREPAEVVRDAGLVAELSRSPRGTALLAVSPGPAEGLHAVTVVAPDRAEVLARVSGAIALAGLAILSVDAYGGPKGLAVDTFVVTSATRRPATTEMFTKLERLAHAALHDRLELATRLSEHRRHYPARNTDPVRVDIDPAGWATAVRVYAPDRPGLLHDIASAVSATGLDIRWAKVQTIDGTARDIFHVVGPDGGPVDDPGVLGHLAMRIREAV